MRALALFIALLLIPSMAWATNYCSSAKGCWLFTDTDYNGGAGTTVDDASPYSNTGTFASSSHPAWSTADVNFHASGSANNSVSFTPNDIINCGSDSSVDSLGSGSFTVTSWINTRTTATARVLFGKGEATTYYGWHVEVSDTKNIGLFVDYSTTDLYAKTTNAITGGTWTHVAVVSSSQVGTIYLDGTPQSSYSTRTTGVGTAREDTSTNLSIGAKYYSGTANYGVDANVTDVGLFAVAYGSTEISDIYDNGLSPSPAPAVAYGSYLGTGIWSDTVFK